MSLRESRLAPLIVAMALLLACSGSPSTPTVDAITPATGPLVPSPETPRPAGPAQSATPTSTEEPYVLAPHLGETAQVWTSEPVSAGQPCRMLVAQMADAPDEEAAGFVSTCVADVATLGMRFRERPSGALQLLSIQVPLRLRESVREVPTRTFERGCEAIEEHIYRPGEPTTDHDWIGACWTPASFVDGTLVVGRVPVDFAGALPDPVRCIELESTYSNQEGLTRDQPCLLDLTPPE